MPAPTYQCSRSWALAPYVGPTPDAPWACLTCHRTVRRKDDRSFWRMPPHTMRSFVESVKQVRYEKKREYMRSYLTEYNKRTEVIERRRAWQRDYLKRPGVRERKKKTTMEWYYRTREERRAKERESARAFAASLAEG